MNAVLKNIPNLITLVNLATGAVGCFWIVQQNDYRIAIYFVLIASVFDFLDGFMARILKVQSEIGKQLDSLSDLVSFGMLPAFFMVTWLQNIGSEYYFSGILVAVFSALRLAKFNIDTSQTYGFKGLPTPANAIMLTSLILLPFDFSEWHLLVIIIGASILLVSNLPLLSLKFTAYQWAGNESRWILILMIVLGLGFFQLKFIPIIIPIYVVISIIGGLITRKS